MAANYTLTGNFQQLTGVADATGQLVITLANYGNVQPRVSGAGILTTAPVVVTCVAGAFTQLLWGNDQVLPTGTYYTVTFKTSSGAVCSSVAYQFNGGGSNDLSTLSPLAATPPLPISNYALLDSPVFTSVPKAPTAVLGTNTTQLATTAFVIANAAAGGVTSFIGRIGAVVAVANDYSFSQISGSVAATQLPNPSATTLGGIQSLAAVASRWINTISTSGVSSATQPAFSDISGSLAVSQFPAVTGDFFVGPGMDPACMALQPTAVVPNGGATANQVSVRAFSLYRPITVNKISYYVGTPSASDKWAFGIYSQNGNTKLVDTGVISPTAGSAGFSITITPVTLNPGVYYFVETSSGTTATTIVLLSGNTGLANTFLLQVFNKNMIRQGVAANASAAGVLPATLGVLTATGMEGGFSMVVFEN